MKWIRPKQTSSVQASGDKVMVRVKHGYQPDTVVARAGRPLRITFRREESSPCSEEVIFPDFGLTAELPQDREVTVDLRAEEAGEYEFTCTGRRCCVGRLIITPVAHEPASAA